MKMDSNTMFLFNVATGEMKNFMSSGLLWQTACIEFRFKKRRKWQKGLFEKVSEETSAITDTLITIQHYKDRIAAEESTPMASKTTGLSERIKQAGLKLEFEEKLLAQKKKINHETKMKIIEPEGCRPDPWWPFKTEDVGYSPNTTTGEYMTMINQYTDYTGWRYHERIPDTIDDVFQVGTSRGDQPGLKYSWRIWLRLLPSEQQVHLKRGEFEHHEEFVNDHYGYPCMLCLCMVRLHNLSCAGIRVTDS